MTKNLARRDIFLRYIKNCMLGRETETFFHIPG